MAKTRDCQECRNFAHDDADRLETGQLCACGHRPRFYNPRSPMPLPHEWGWKRRCDSFVPIDAPEIEGLPMRVIRLIPRPKPGPRTPAPIKRVA